MSAASQTTYTAKAEALALAYANVGSNLPLSTGQLRQGSFAKVVSQPSSGVQNTNSASTPALISSSKI